MIATLTSPQPVAAPACRVQPRGDRFEDYDTRIAKISPYDPFYQGCLWEEEQDEPAEAEAVTPPTPSEKAHQDRDREYEVLVARISRCDLFYRDLSLELGA